MTPCARNGCGEQGLYAATVYPQDAPQGVYLRLCGHHLGEARAAGHTTRPAQASTRPLVADAPMRTPFLRGPSPRPVTRPPRLVREEVEEVRPRWVKPLPKSPPRRWRPSERGPVEAAPAAKSAPASAPAVSPVPSVAPPVASLEPREYVRSGESVMPKQPLDPTNNTCIVRDFTPERWHELGINPQPCSGPMTRACCTRHYQQLWSKKLVQSVLIPLEASLGLEFRTFKRVPVKDPKAKVTDPVVQPVVQPVVTPPAPAVPAPSKSKPKEVPSAPEPPATTEVRRLDAPPVVDQRLREVAAWSGMDPAAALWFLAALGWESWKARSGP